MNISRVAARARARVRWSVRRRRRPERDAPKQPATAAVAASARGAMSHAEVRTDLFRPDAGGVSAALNQTIVATALPTIGRHFDDFENLSWVVTAYLLTSTAVSPLYGKLSDIYGRRAMMLAAHRPVHRRLGAVRGRAQHDVR